MKKNIVSCFVVGALILISGLANANEGYIVRFKSQQEANDFIQNSGLSDQAELLLEELHIYKIKPAARAGLSVLRSDKRVQYAQKDHAVQLRGVTPNDPDFSKQWGLQKIAASEAWELGTNGKTLDGDEIVVAVIDGGVDIKHNDLKENIWVNKNEIAGNNIDDDANGYIDDVNGWNAYSNNGNIVSNSHGTHVSGIVSAAGNNGVQVAGVNWNVKVMAIPGSSSTTSTIVKAYGYALKQKKLYIETKGAKGANVVSTNSSFGVDYGKCETGEFPVWNDLYTEMGKAGILSAAATANIGMDIDASGDVPTGCESPYMVSVTNTTSTDERNSGAGWGLKTIDIGAPGTAVLSTIPGNATASYTGTSMATPHIAGAIAYIHSVASPQLTELVKNDPAAGALAVKKIMMDSVDVIPALKGKTVSGGRLNLSKAGKAAYNFVK